MEDGPGVEVADAIHDLAGVVAHLGLCHPLPVVGDMQESLLGAQLQHHVHELTVFEISHKSHHVFVP